ncbi:hypothetical protein JW968_05995 [Candidatus Woesearchaeota archaeon]|nr:hypothetical protein [Candidatus Woesearchaeota archaeon]
MAHLEKIRQNTQQVMRLLDILEKSPRDSSLPTHAKIRFAKDKLLRIIYENEINLKRMIR